ncbi:MAG: ATP-binding protein [Firmicutes bacterium]|nr:ATP-binding protein [Bacillota bacterium]
MKKYISNLSIAKKLALSFALIITLFLLIIIYNLYFTSYTQSNHGYFVNYVMDRNRILTELQIEFRLLTNIVRNTLNESSWLSTADEQQIIDLNNDIISRIYILHQLANEYLISLEQDALISDLVGYGVQYRASQSMQLILNNIQDIQNYYVVPVGHFNRDYVFMDVLTVYATPTINAIEDIRNVNLNIIQIVGTNLYVQQGRHFAFNAIAFIVVAFIAFLIVKAVLADFDERIKLLKNAAISLKMGHFDQFDKNIPNNNDEIGNLAQIMLDVNSTVENLVDQVYNTSTEVINGNFSKTLDTFAFQGNYAKMASSINNLTKIVMSTISLKAEKEYYDYLLLLFDKAPVIITVWDSNLDIINCNEEVMRRYGISSKEEYKENFLRFSPQFQANGKSSKSLALKYLKETIEKGSTKFEWLHQDIHGTIIPSEIISIKGEFMGNQTIISYCSDLRHVYAMLEEMERSATAEANSKAKTQFLARMSHEIRTPINAVLGISEIQLQNPSLEVSTEEAFAKIYSSSQILLGLINDILDLSRIESGKMPILQEKYDSASLINDIIQLNVFRLGSKKVKFEIQVDKNIPAVMVGDELRIKQILNNLLSNAFKYTEKGSVNLTIIIKTGKQPHLCFTIQDTGIGMSPENLQKLFHEFARFNEEKTRYIEGAGLGMSIVQNLIELMDAKIDVQSKLGKGTTITLEIPQKISGDEVLGAELAKNLQNFNLSSRFARKTMSFKPEPMPYGKVLVVDDVETNLFVAKGLLSFYEIEVDTCDNGNAAINLVQQGKIYDIIFLDHMMPGLDGIETNAKIRELGYTAPIVALTANAIIGQSDKFLQNGFDGFISKPIDTSHLNAMLNKFIRDKQPPEVIANIRNEIPQQAANSDMWNFFTDNGSSEKSNQFFQDLLKEFARSQRHIILDIRQALSKDDLLSCRRIAHTLKGLANTIHETELAKTAGYLEVLFEQNKSGAEVAEKIDLMERQLAAVIATIPKEETHTNTEPITENINELLLELRALLEESNADSLDLIKKLDNVPQACTLIQKVNNFDFENALLDLDILLDLFAQS